MRTSTAVAGLLLSVLTGLPVDLAAQRPAWSFSAQSARPLPLPAGIASGPVRAALSYPDTPDEPVAGFLADINQDGTEDYILRSSLDACGSNCDYLLIDGLSMTVLGRVGGSLIYVGPPAINGYPVIHTYGHSSADAGYWTTLVFDGRSYVDTGTVYLEGQSAERLFDSLSDVPPGPLPRP